MRTHRSVAFVVCVLFACLNIARADSVGTGFLANIGSSPKPLESVEIAERVKLFTVMVECESGGQRVAGIANGTEDQPSRADGGSLETRAASFIIEIERLSSGSSPSIVQKLASLYDNKVDYYGTSRSHDEVMTDKMRYFTRWPERRYSIIPGSLKVNCSSTTKFCDVTGAVEFSVDGMDRHSEGTATFAYGIAETSSGFRILSEAGNVITRHR